MDAFSQWLTASELGQYLLARELAFFDGAVADAFGYHALQIGLPQVDFLRENRIPWQCRTAASKPADVVCDGELLPFATRSLDLLVMPHVLDFCEHPHQVLREAERVLMPEGRLVLTGFNPVSLWGARRALQGRFPEPWNGNFLSLVRIKDWFALLGLEPSGGAFMGYAPPFNRSDWLDSFRFMEAAGDRWWPLAAGVYGIEAIKRQRSMRLITPNWKQQAASGLVVAGGSDHQPVSRQHTDETT
ncbi:class I SAM-dependent methyltransferase [Paludibacterium yongneupense]|uniref:class I SAM-dependent methyltransferase n=1 Tax=Paludibacterium yongneupense TaxID=400061 RepID=UPI000426C5C9|nr:methyltransferase domain-containing protein [Paludibacterium yongneupense]